MKIIYTVFVLGFLASVSCSQDSEPSRFALTFGAGPTVHIYKYSFSIGPEDVPFKLGYNFSTSLSYTMPVVDQTNLEIILQGLFAYASTGTITEGVKKFELNVQHTNILSWFRLISSSSLSPYIELGVGYGRAAYSENIISQVLRGGFGTASGLVLGAGAGLALRLSDRLQLQGSVQTTYLTKEVYLFDVAERSFYRPSIAPVSVRVAYSL